jgi:hypothetical protein
MDKVNDFSIFEYLYRDASNYKAWGKLLLSGTVSESCVITLQQCLESEEFFIAEQVGIPPLYKELWNLSGGPTNDDHAFHTFFKLRPATAEEIATFPLWGELSLLLTSFRQVDNQWSCTLSPNFCGVGGG